MQDGGSSIDVSYGKKLALAWLRHKDSNYFTAREIAFIYQHRNLIKNAAQTYNLWPQKDIDSFEDEIFKRFNCDVYFKECALRLWLLDKGLLKEIVEEIWGYLTPEELREINDRRVRRKCEAIASIPVVNPLLTKRAFSNMLMVESALMLWVLNAGGDVTDLPIIINLAVVAADWYRARRKLSVEDWQDSNFDKRYDIVMASMSGLSFAMSGIGASVFAASYVAEDWYEKVGGVAVFCFSVYAVLHASHRSLAKYRTEKDGRGVEENIYVSLATATMSNFVIFAATDGHTMQLKLGLQAGVLACVYAYDKYQDQVYSAELLKAQKEMGV